MKTFKLLFFVLLILIIGGCTFIAVQPNSYNVFRSRTIKAPLEVVFSNINDFKNWEDWSPWIENDPTINITYGNQTSGSGGSYTWISEEGNGEMKTLLSTPYDSINMEMKFEDFPPSNVYFRFYKIEGGTEVTWGMKASSVPFMLKLYVAINGGMDNIIGPDYERGLEKLDSVIVNSMKAFKITVNGITEYGGGFYLYKTTNATSENISQMMGRQYGAIGAFMVQNGIPFAGMPLTVYHEMNTNDNSVIMSNGIPVSEKIETPTDSDVLCGFIPKLKALKVTLKGNYTNLNSAWDVAMKYIAENNLVQADQKPFEIYTNDPGEFPNPANWTTEIYIPIVE